MQSVTLDPYMFTGLHLLSSYTCILISRENKPVYQGQMEVMVPSHQEQPLSVHLQVTF